MKKRPSPLNKKHFDGCLWIAADVHLGPHAPKTAAAFYAFLERAAQQADTLILCGDIFEAWIGDDVAKRPSPWLEAVIHALRVLTKTTQLYLMRGNRDFLLGEQFATHVNGQCLPDELIISTPQCEFLLAHGDQFCTDDEAYQRYRRVVHQPWLQRLFLCLPLRLRKKIATSLRQQSKQRNYAVLGDIHEPDTALFLEEHAQTLLIHGHTHQPAIHRFGAQQALTRIVIPDWEYDHSHPRRGGWVSIDPSGKVGLHLDGQPTRYLC